LAVATLVVITRLASMDMSVLPVSLPHGGRGLALIYLNGVPQLSSVLPNHREGIA
jgi:hypothetical protein